MTGKKENIRLLLSLGLAGILMTAIFWLIGKVSSKQLLTSKPSINNVLTSPLETRTSSGERILVTADANPDKQAGVQAFASADFTTAVKKFQSSLSINRNDPETLIYLNNAKIGKLKALKVAVSVPISDTLNEAKETLRGIAHVQDEVNRTGGINGVPLQIEIANNDGNNDTLKQLDHQFVEDKNILAVVGYSLNDSIYNQGGLVRVSPVNQQKSFVPAKYVFYATPNPDVFAYTLGEYAVRKAHLKNVAICFDSTLSVNNQIVEEYVESINQFGGKVLPTACDLGAPDFRASTVISKAIADGAEGLILAPTFDKINPAIDVAHANHGRLQLFGSQLMYTQKTLQLGQEDVKGMVLAVHWHRDAIPGNSFSVNASKLWGGLVSPRTATAYDALEAIIVGLKQANTRAGLQKALSDSNFSAMGATGKIQFSPNGDRKGGVFLVKIEPSEKSGGSGTGFDFTLVH